MIGFHWAGKNLVHTNNYAVSILVPVLCKFIFVLFQQHKTMDTLCCIQHNTAISSSAYIG